MMKRTVLIVLAFLIGISLVSGSPEGNSGQKTDTVIIGHSPIEAAADYYVGEEKGFFSSNGINVIRKEYDNGPAVFKALETGEIDLGATSEFPLVTKAFEKADIKVLASTVRMDYMFLVGRKDRGINNGADLTGKSIGVSMGTAAEFYLGMFLELQGISVQNVSLTNINIIQPSSFFSQTEFDAAVFFQPYAQSVIDSLGDNATVWPVQSNQPAFGLLSAKQAWAKGNHELATRILKAFDQSHAYIKAHPEETARLVRNRLKLPEGYLAAVWPNYRFALSLDQSLIMAMEDEARWMIANNLTTETRVPNFLDYIYTDVLKSVKPGAVKIVGK